MKRRTLLVFVPSLILAALATWLLLRSIFPAGEVNYLNYRLLKRASSIEEVERVIGPFDDNQIDAFTHAPVIRPTNENGVVTCVWSEKSRELGATRIHITFVDGRATEFRYVTYDYKWLIGDVPEK